jgi:hypothetical protein
MSANGKDAVQISLLNGGNVPTRDVQLIQRFLYLFRMKMEKIAGFFVGGKLWFGCG